MGWLSGIFTFGTEVMKSIRERFKAMNTPVMRDNATARIESKEQDEDEKLVARAQKGDADAIEELRKRGARPQ